METQAKETKTCSGVWSCSTDLRKSCGADLKSAKRIWGKLAMRVFTKPADHYIS
jgi:hypothetical protein